MSTVSDLAAVTPTETSPTSSSSELQAQLPTAADFLQILTAEFQDQDPTEPVDPTEFASQLVDFANLAQLQNIDSAVTQPPSNSLMQAASAFIGREIVAPGNSIGVQNGQATSITYQPTSTDSYTADIFNSAGQQVASVSLGQQSGGSTQTFTWQPSSSIPAGQYTVNIVNSSNSPLSGLLEQGVVQSVSLSNGAVSLNLGNLTVSDSQVSSVAPQPAN
jgi:flagellar basal-body rod modification protein FlgD